MQIDSEKFSIEDGSTITSDNVSIAYRTYVPKDEGPFPVVLIGHGFSASKEIMDGYARVLASSGFIVYNYDHRGHGTSGGSLTTERDVLVRDVEAIREVVRADPRAKQGEYGLVGYSMGGGAGYQMAQRDPNLITMIGVAPALDEVSIYPDNLLVIVGALDELFSPSSYQSLLSSRVALDENQIEHGVTYAVDDTTTKLWVSPYHDHLTIAYSAAAHERCVEWMTDSLGGTVGNIDSTQRMYLTLLGVVSGIAAILCGLCILPIRPTGTRIRTRTTSSPGKDILHAVIFTPLTALLVLPTIVFGLPMTTGYLLFLSVGAIPLWRTLRKHNPNKSVREVTAMLFNAPRKSYITALVGGAAIYVVLAIFLGGGYLGIVPAMSRFPATIIVFIYLTMALSLDAWAYMNSIQHTAARPHVIRILRYAAIRMVSIAIIIGILTVVSQNTFFLIALYVGIPIVILYSVVMAIIMQKTGSYGAAAVTCALILSAMLVAVSPLIAIF